VGQPDLEVSMIAAVDTAEAVDAGAEGNTRLTSVTGLILAALLLVEGFTILDVGGELTLHMFIGLMLIPPVLLKTATTIYRFGAYYGGREAYVHRGPPHIILRLIGPLVVLSTLSVLGTGGWLLALGHRDGTVLTLHQASFIVWIGFMTLHFLGHALEAVAAGWREVASRRADPARRGRGVRLVAVIASLALGVGLAAAFTPSSLSGFDRGEQRTGVVTHR
jgi:hypothetical protein